MGYVALPAASAASRMAAGHERWNAILAARPDLAPAVDLQRALIALVVGLTDRIEQARLPRLPLPPKSLAPKLGRGVPIFAGEPIPLPVAALRGSLLQFCDALAAGGAREAASHIRVSLEKAE